MESPRCCSGHRKLSALTSSLQCIHRRPTLSPVTLSPSSSDRRRHHLLRRNQLLPYPSSDAAATMEAGSRRLQHAPLPRSPAFRLDSAKQRTAPLFQRRRVSFRPPPRAPSQSPSRRHHYESSKSPWLRSLPPLRLCGQQGGQRLAPPALSIDSKPAPTRHYDECAATTTFGQNDEGNELPRPVVKYRIEGVKAYGVNKLG